MSAYAGHLGILRVYEVLHYDNLSEGARMKTQVVGSVKEFLNGKYSRKSHLEKYGIIYKAAGIATIILLTGDVALASDGVDAGARTLYYELVRIGKWVIVFKGGVDTIKAIGDGDTSGAKKAFLSSLITYLFLLGLPYGMDKVDGIFSKIKQVNGGV
jgi:hypothetical protein